MLTGITAGTMQLFGSVNLKAANAAAQTALAQGTSAAQATASTTVAAGGTASGGFSADAADGRVTLTQQGQWTPEDFYTGMPQALMDEYYAVTTSEQKDWQALTKDVTAGDLQTAQTDLASYEQLQPAGGGATQDAALKALSTALTSGDQTAAATALTTATGSLTNQLIDGGNSPMLLAQAANDALATPNWTEELTNFGGTVAPATIGQAQTSGDAFTQDLEAIQLDAAAGTSGMANFLKTQGYSSDLATADAQMMAYQWTVGSLSTVVHDVADETNSGATFEISHSLTSAGTVGGTDRAYTLSTDEEFSGNTGIKDTVTESELALTATGAIATAAVVEFGPSRPPSSTAAVSVDRSAAAAALSSLSGYQTSFSVTEVQSSVSTASVSQGSIQATVGTTQSGTPTTSLKTENAWASVAMWEQTVDSYAAGKSSWTIQSTDRTSAAKIDTAFESASHQTLELVAMTMGSETTSQRS